MQGRSKQAGFLNRGSAHKVSCTLPPQIRQIQTKPKNDTDTNNQKITIDSHKPQTSKNRLIDTKSPTNTSNNILSKQFSGELQTEPSRQTVSQHQVTKNHWATENMSTAYSPFSITNKPTKGT
jgi:stress-induced morphogen